MVRGPGRGDPRSYAIVIAHGSAIAVVSISKPPGGSVATTGALANVSGGDPHLKCANVLMVGTSFSIVRKIALTKHASDSARCSALLVTFSVIATFSKRWLGHVG